MRLAAWCGVAGLVLLAAARAHADWRTTVSVKGRPNDLVEVWQPGNFSVGVGQGAHLFLDGGFSRTLDGGVEPAGTYYHASDDCFLSVRKDGAGTRNSSSADGGLCGAGTNPFDSITPIASNVRRVKHATDGGAVALVDEPPSTYVYLSDTSIYDTTDFTEVAGIDDSINGSLGVVRVDGKLYSLLGTSSPSSLVYWVDGSRMESWAPSEPMGAVWGIDLFPAGSPAFPYAVVGTQQGILQGSTSASGHQLKRVQGFDAGVGVTSVSMNVGAGSAAGQGFGMALVAQPDGGVAVASPVPMLDDTQAGTVWRFRPLPASVAAAPLKQVACTGASYCVFTADRTDTINVFIYTNDAGPALSLEAPGAAVTGNAMDASVALDEGQTVTLTLSASDPEGDPVLVTASPLSVTSAQWSVVPAVGPLPGDPVVLSVTGGTLCQSQQVGSFSVSASDGLAAHDAHQAIQVSVNHSRPPEVPGVVLPDGGVVLPDGGLAAGEVVAGMS
ncbi:MAG: hypothetical protein ACXU86_22040, partial [Archangium sp.]